MVQIESHAPGGGNCPNTIAARCRRQAPRLCVLFWIPAACKAPPLATFKPSNLLTSNCCRKRWNHAPKRSHPYRHTASQARPESGGLAADRRLALNFKNAGNGGHFRVARDTLASRTIKSKMRPLVSASFRQASKQLHVSQPSLSVQIKQLEDELGVALFRRSKRWIEITRGGEVFLSAAREILLRLQQASAAALHDSGASCCGPHERAP